jgi:hypothetical protein
MPTKTVQVPLNYVVYVVPTGSVFGPFSSKGHAKLWATTGAGGLEYYTLRYVDLIRQPQEKVSHPRCPIHGQHQTEGEPCEYCEMDEDLKRWEREDS